MTDKQTTVLVLTPSLGGDFFGDVLSGLTRALVAADARPVVVETLQEFNPRDEAGTPGEFDTPVAWSQVDAVISLTTAVGPAYVKQVQDLGKPVVLLSSTQMDDIAVPEARPDNHRGTITAVEHLIDHGHTRIGFVGNLAQLDIRERYEAFQEVLARRGLTHDPRLFFASPENAESGGAKAARLFLQSSQRPTAVMVATDRNALGFMHALSQAGLSIPQDIAVVGFDNIPTGTYSSPSLTTVDPRFDEVGALAARLAVAAVDGDVPEPVTSTPERSELVVRGSCGCAANGTPANQATPTATTAATSSPTDSARAPERAAALHAAVTGALEHDLLTGVRAIDSGVQQAIASTADLAVRVVEAGAHASPEQIADLMDRVEGLTARPDSVRRVADAVLAAARGRGLAGADVATLAAALWKSQASAFLHTAERTDAAIAEQYVVDAGLLATEGTDPQELQWLEGTRVRAAALGLWDQAPGGTVTVVGEYHRGGDSLGLLDTTVPCEEFPDHSLIGAGRASAKEVCVVVPVKTQTQDWGLLSLVGELDPTTVRESYQHWAALLCAALESQRRQEEVRRSALFDALTGLPNRQLFVQQLDKALARWRRDGTPFSVLFLDLDGFKLVNDSLGHHMGDRVLMAVAEDISREVRTVDTAARFGGDEFVMLLADTEPGRAMVAAKRIQQALSDVRTFDGHEILTRASIGIASSEVGYNSAEDVLRDADAAMYRAKSVEPGTIAYFDAPMHASAQRRAELAREVLRGLQEDQFEVHFQPIVNLDTGRTDRFESLVRWRHPERGMIEPAEFLADIEETSLIVQLGRWVLNEVCSRLVSWRPRVTNVSINISDKEFWSQDLLTNVMTTLERYDLPPDVLTLEITESVLMRRPEMSLRIMHKLHDAGLRLHIDDFGTGYSSLETLHRFPVEAFKIDRSFIQSLTDTENSAELISSLVKLGKALGLAVLAEGVETEEQLAFLQSLGCATGQGFLFMPAVTGDKVEELLGKSLHENPEAE